MEDEHDDHERTRHGRLDELARIAFVAVAAAAVWFRVWEPFPSRQRDRLGGHDRRRLADLPRSVGEHPRAPDDDGTVDDDRAGGGARHRRVLHGAGDHGLRARGRGAGRAHRRPRPSRHSRPARLPAGHGDGPAGERCPPHPAQPGARRRRRARRARRMHRGGRQRAQRSFVRGPGHDHR